MQNLETMSNFSSVFGRSLFEVAGLGESTEGSGFAVGSVTIVASILFGPIIRPFGS
jgi:hypothetical protein